MQKRGFQSKTQNKPVILTISNIQGGPKGGPNRVKKGFFETFEAG